MKVRHRTMLRPSLKTQCLKVLIAIEIAMLGVFGVVPASTIIGAFDIPLPTFAGMTPFTVPEARADIPTTLGYQGRLKNASGTALTGTYSFIFRVYASSTGGPLLWNETQSVVVDSGYFAVQLGSVTPFAMDMNQALYLTTEVSADGEMTPRVPINSVSFAYTAGGVNAFAAEPTSASGGRMYYNTATGNIYYFDAIASIWRQLTSTSTATNLSSLVFGNATGASLNLGNLNVTGTTNLMGLFTFVNGTGTSLSVTNLSTTNFTPTNITWANATGTNTTSTNLYASNANISNLLWNGATGTSLNVTQGTTLNTLSASGSSTLTTLNFTNATGTGLFATNIRGTTGAFTSSLTVGGTNVCLSDGTNCPGGGGIDDWNYSSLTNILSPVTSTASVALGGVTEGSPFFFRVQPTSSRLLLGANGSSTDVVIGGPTSTITNTAFQLDGNDLFVAGNIGSASSVYTNGAFIASSTTYGDGFISKTNGDLSLSASGGIFMNPSGNVGIGVTTTASKLQILHSSTQILNLARTQAASDSGGYLFFTGGTLGNTVRGYMGFAQTGGGPATILTGALNDSLAIRAEGALHLGSGGDNIRMTLASGGNIGIGTTSPNTTLEVIGITSSTQVQFVNGTSTSSFGFNTASGSSLFVGGYAVCLSNGTNCPASSAGSDDWTYSLSNDFVRPNKNTTSLVLGASNATEAPFWFRIDSTSSRLYLGAFGSSTNLVVGGSTSTHSNTAFHLDGNDLFVAGNIGSASSVYTNGAFIAGSGSTLYGDGFITKTNGTLNVTSTGNTVLGGVNVILQPFGGYVGIGTATPAQKLELATGNIIIDRHPTSGTLNRSQYIGISDVSGAFGDIIAGAAIKFESVADGGNSSQSIHFKTHHTGVSAGIRMTIDKDGNVGIGTQTPSTTFEVIGVASSTGLVAYYATTTFATATVMEVTNKLTVGSVAVCLANGTNCPSSSAESDTLASVTQRGASATTTVTLFGGLVTSNLTATGSYSFVDGVERNATSVNIATTNLTVTGTANIAALAVSGLTTLQNFTFANATGTTLTLTGALSAASTTRRPPYNHDNPKKQ